MAAGPRAYPLGTGTLPSNKTRRTPQHAQALRHHRLRRPGR
nr:MAG TPA: hypothetical protein [Caudoviricetes sp.]